MNPPEACPVCGAYSLSYEGRSSALLAVADVLCLKALEKVGSRLVRSDRSRFNELDGRPFYLAHTLWPEVNEETISRALKGAWDVVPALLDGHGWSREEDVTSDAVIGMLDQYVHDLVITGTVHRLEELHYRFTHRLRLPVYLHPERDHVAR